MTLANKPNRKSSSKRLLSVLFLAPLLFSTTVTLRAQTPQLSLADLVIALRSKKATLPERNKILVEAVRQRGITFNLTSDIEKELSTTGADPELLTAIRVKSPTVKPVEMPKSVAAPAPTPAPPDFSFYQRRADDNAGKGELAQALADYTKAAEMKSNEPSIYFGRGKTHFIMKSYELSITDFTKTIELNPRSSVAHFSRGGAYEKLGDPAKAMADYQAAVDLDSANEAAKSSLKRLKDEAAAAAAAAEEKRKAAELAKAPEFVGMGNLTAADATRMAKPVYSPMAQRTNIEGRVIVELEIDVDGNVTSAKATSGPQMLRQPAEDAASKSKFKPAMFAGKAIKGKGSITYNFELHPDR
ncbi:MAG: TonB family protein [Pyrinomonadaceae bacterium]